MNSLELFYKSRMVSISNRNRLDYWKKKCAYQTAQSLTAVARQLCHRFFIFCFIDFFRNKLRLEDEIKIKFIRVSFDFNSVGKWSK